MVSVMAFFLGVLLSWPVAGRPYKMLQNFLPVQVPRPDGPMVGHAWKNRAGDIIEHWITGDDEDLYYRYVAADFVPRHGAIESGKPVDGCIAVIPAHSHGNSFAKALVRSVVVQIEIML